MAASCSSCPMTSTSDPSVSFTMTPREACTLSGRTPSSLKICSYFGLHVHNAPQAAPLGMPCRHSLSSRMQVQLLGSGADVQWEKPKAQALSHSEIRLVSADSSLDI